MTQAELDREVARATGENVATVKEMGFVPLTRTPVETFDELNAYLCNT